MIATGRRDKRVLLENPARVSDNEGGYTESWAPLDPAGVFAHVTPASARDLEYAAAGTVIATAAHLIEILYHPGVTVQTRITYGTRVFQVASLRNPDEANRELILIATELVDKPEPAPAAAAPTVQAPREW